jgi:tRNA dimethylallyltransferase
MNHNELITILGPTASGKTSFAAALADRLDSEIISADSRQVYRSMDIGTGKDLADYVVGGKTIPYHLIDILEAGDKYNLFEYQHDFHLAYSSIRQKGKLPILCGGTGMYIEAVLKGFRLLNVPENKPLRDSLQGRSLDELTLMLAKYGPMHNKTDVDTAQRAIRAIEIAEYTQARHPDETEFPPLKSLIVGLDIGREARRTKISARLKSRLDEGMVDEIRNILEGGVKADDLIYYGLEYKYVTLFLQGKLTYKEMFEQLEIAIHQFAKRQMTWFRGMERRGFAIHWMPYDLPTEEKLEQVKLWMEG